MELTIIQAIILGIVQGVTEWIPISSSAAMVLILSNFFKVTSTEVLVRTSLFFHMGTFLAALVYFRKEVKQLTHDAFRYKYVDQTQRRTLKFLLFSTIVSGAVGAVLIFSVIGVGGYTDIPGKTISFAIGVFLLVTGIIQLRIRRGGKKRERDLKINDGILLGISQGVAVVPGISRSGITISTLLLRKFDETSTLRLSFLMSLPIVLIGNIILNLRDFAFSMNGLYGIIVAFVFGLLTIHGLMKVSRKINFGYFVLAFAVLMMLSIFI